MRTMIGYRAYPNTTPPVPVGEVVVWFPRNGWWGRILDSLDIGRNVVRLIALPPFFTEKRWDHPGLVIHDPSFQLTFDVSKGYSFEPILAERPILVQLHADRVS